LVMDCFLAAQGSGRSLGKKSLMRAVDPAELAVCCEARIV
jgi:hypothetical protein